MGKAKSGILDSNAQNIDNVMALQSMTKQNK